MKTPAKTLPALICALCLLVPPALRAAPGDLDPLDLNIFGGVAKFVWAMAVQPDGKTIIAGEFTSVLGVPRNNIARINAEIGRAHV